MNRVLAALSLFMGAVGLAQDRPVWLVRPADLAREAKDAPATVARLFRALAVPADQVVLNDGSVLSVEPIDVFVGSKPKFTGSLELKVLSDKKDKLEVTSAEVASVTPYEHTALAGIRGWMDEQAKADLPPATRFRAAERALEAVLRFHLENRLRPAVGDNPWAPLQGTLEHTLVDVRRQHLAWLAETAKDDAAWRDALRHGDRLLATYPHEQSMAEALRRLWGRAAEHYVQAGAFATARTLVNRLDDASPFSPEGDAARNGLRERAAALVKESAGLADDLALPKLDEALRLWPQRARLRDDILKRRAAYTVLYVGVRRLPEFFSPATAWTDAERQAAELLFESLVQPVESKNRGEHFEARLAGQVPSPPPDPEGPGWQRTFPLRRDAYWSDGQRVTSADVRHTILLLSSPQLPGRVPAWTDLVELPRVEGASFAVSLRLRQRGIEPLSLLSFKVLPQQFRGKPLERADDAEFAKAPVGSGPYRFVERRADKGRDYVTFAANTEAERTGQRTSIREIRFFAWQDPSDLRALPHPAHLLLGIRTEELNALRGLGFRDVRSRPAGRVAFLGVNHRVPALRKESLRRFLAHAIDRERLLTEHMRGGPPILQHLGPAGSAVAAVLGKHIAHPEFHTPLNGPYPRTSWACCPAPRVPLSLYDPELAKSYARQAHKELGAVELTLKYPSDDPRSARACRDLAEEASALAASAGADIRLKLEPQEPRQLKQALERRDFQLAYTHWDYRDETYWLWPLFDPHADAVAPGGSNVLGYDNDAKLQTLMRDTLHERRFSVLQELTHSIHAHLVERMPLIPLWQLHDHVAVDGRLQALQLDPPFFFSHVREWKLSR